MKKNIHPYKTSTIIIYSNGSTFFKKWNFLKKKLKSDFDFFNNKTWNSLDKIPLNN